MHLLDVVSALGLSGILVELVDKAQQTNWGLCSAAHQHIPGAFRRATTRHL